MPHLTPMNGEICSTVFMHSEEVKAKSIRKTYPLEMKRVARA